MHLKQINWKNMLYAFTFEQSVKINFFIQHDKKIQFV